MIYRIRLTLYTIDNLSIHKLPYMDLQCDLLDPHKNMYACMQNLEVAVLCMCRCVPVLAIINLLDLFWVLFDQIICIGINCYIFCKHFVKDMGSLSFYKSSY